MPARAANGDFRLDYSGVGAAPPSAATGCGCNVTGPGGCCVGQQLQAHGGQVSPGPQAGQAQAQPPEPLPASTGKTSFSCAHEPVGHGVVMHSMLSEVQPHPSAVSALQ